MRTYINTCSQRGFALIEVLVALSILSLVSLMAWQGMDAMIRGNEVIEHRSNVDASYLQLVKQFDKDCSEVPNFEQLGFSPIRYSHDQLWLLRQVKVNGQTHWLLVTYITGSEGFLRKTISNISELSELNKFLTAVSQNPSSDYPDSETTLKINDISNQVFLLLPESEASNLNSRRGIQAQWFVKNVKDPITRLCLIGQGT